MRKRLKFLLSTGPDPAFSVILGSGFQIDQKGGIEEAAAISFEDAGFKPKGKVDGHGYRIALYRFNNISFLAFHGRLHLYEGYSQGEVAFPAVLTEEAGIERILITSASGGISDSVETGDLVQIVDHINLTGGNPLQADFKNHSEHTFQELCTLYSNSFSEKVERAIAKADLPQKSGVLAAVPGPVYETPAETRFLKTIGADMVSMSVVPEAIYAHYLGIKTAGLTAISNHHFKNHNIPNHENILKNVHHITNKFNKLLVALLRELEAVP